MKYPIFAFATGGLFVELVHTMTTQPLNQGAAFLFGIGVVGLTLIGATFEAVWNFKRQ